jgi:subtilisin family serine protease
MREYNVILKEGIDYDEFWNDIESDTDNGKLYIPNRKVEFTNERPGSLRQCWYLLTDEEAEQLKLDERVFDVEIPPEKRDDLKMVLKAVQRGDFTKVPATTDAGSYINWGLIRSNFDFNCYGAGTTVTSSYEYSLTGDGVDVVIQDSGLQIDHPEFQDEFGVTRVQQINWYTESGISGTQSANHYRDYDGHGTHVASTVAGKYFGWAKKARVYSQKLSGLEGSGDSGTGISVTDAFDSIKLWHRNKPNDPKTGAKRPTVVNMSWGYIHYFTSLSSLTYRGTTYTNTTATVAANRESNYGFVQNYDGSYYYANSRISSVDTDIDEMIAEGIHVVIAAGNFGFKIDLSGGDDYNNQVVTSGGNGGTYYYHRGSSPYSTNAIKVGNADSASYNSTTDQKATSSETGPGVDIYAPGTAIMGACSTTNNFTDEAYFANSSFRQMNISGTSMASPQVAGVSALILQMNPKLKPSELKTYLLNNSNGDIYATLNNNDWSNRRSLWGGVTRFLYNKFGISQASRISGDLTFKGGFIFKVS